MQTALNVKTTKTQEAMKGLVTVSKQMKIDESPEKGYIPAAPYQRR